MLSLTVLDSKRNIFDLSFIERLDLDLSLLVKGIQNRVVFTVMSFMLQ